MGRCGGYAKTVSTVVPGVEGRDPASFAGTPGVDERLQPGTARQGGDATPAGALSHEPSQRSIDVIVPVDLVVPVGLYCTKKLQKIFQST